MTTATTRPVDYRELMKKVEQVVGAIQRADDIGTTIRTVMDGLITQFREELGILGGRLYRRQGKVYVLQATFGEAKPAPPGLEVPRSYGPIQLVLEHGAVFMTPDDPRVDPQFEDRIGARQFAAVEVGEEDYLLAVDVATDVDRDDILFSLGILRHSLNQKIRQERMVNIFNEARKIQASILPRREPEFGGFEVCGRTRQMEDVGGDFYDYIPITEKILGLAIADVSGHGLPAALQVRDIYMGLRMGMARDFKIVRTVERLNQIIHQSTLTSRFVSMFYGELEISGLFIYVNAGHPPPFRLTPAGEVDRGVVDFLEEGGPVLGPLPDAAYERGMVRTRPGDLLVLYTDGITETRGRVAGALHSEEYGIDRLVATCREHRHLPASELVDAVFADLDRFTDGRPPSDDRTLLVVRRTGS
ncbi:MAG TPA: PP2C family protein-serine/threonine phosphatase [Thermoanaerobaculia bacterium]|nr:PP2C family protein-serine/threonine phosphatase [Thermoanaerobaculia bacterium]